MKKYYITNCGFRIEIDEKKAIQIKTLQMFYKLQKAGKNPVYKEVEKIIKEQFEKKEL